MEYSKIVNYVLTIKFTLVRLLYNASRSVACNWSFPGLVGTFLNKRLIIWNPRSYNIGTSSSFEIRAHITLAQAHHLKSALIPHWHRLIIWYPRSSHIGTRSSIVTLS